MEGENKNFNEEGQLILKSNHRRGVLHGPRFLYYDDGTIYEKSNWKKGKPFGKYLIYDEGGEIELEGTFE